MTWREKLAALGNPSFVTDGSGYWETMGDPTNPYLFAIAGETTTINHEVNRGRKQSRYGVSLPDTGPFMDDPCAVELRAAVPADPDTVDWRRACLALIAATGAAEGAGYTHHLWRYGVTPEEVMAIEAHEIPALEDEGLGQMIREELNRG